MSHDGRQAQSCVNSPGRDQGHKETPTIVQAIFAYKPVNNDELRLEKGDIVTVTQCEDGGWWEGTLNGRTGWFPTNYVICLSNPVQPPPPHPDDPHRVVSSPSSMMSSSGGGPSAGGIGRLSGDEIHQASPSGLSGGNKLITKSADGILVSSTTTPNSGHLGGGVSVSSSSSSSSTSAGVTPEETVKYRAMVLADFIESEQRHLSALEEGLNEVLGPIGRSGILTKTEFKTLSGNLEELISTHRSHLLELVRVEGSKALRDQRLGKIFLENAPKIESAVKAYCENHPRAVQVIDSHRKSIGDFLESHHGATPSGPGVGPSSPPVLLTLLTLLSQPFRRLEKYPLVLQELERHVQEFHRDRGDLQRSVQYYKEIDKNCGLLRRQKEMELEVLNGSINDWEGPLVTQLGDIIHMNLVHIGTDGQPRYFVLFSNTLLVILSYDSETKSFGYKGKIPVTGITLTPLSDKERGLPFAFEIAGPMLDPILVSCASRAQKDGWLEQFNKILRASRFPNGGVSLGPHRISFGQLTPPVQAWNISKLRPAPPYNPFLAECLALEKEQQQQNGTTAGGNINNSGKPLLGPTGTTLPSPTGTITLSHEEDFILLSIVDAFCAKSRQSSSGSSPKHLNVGSQTQLGTKGALTELVVLLRDEVSSLKSNMARVNKKLEDEQAARKILQNYVELHLQNNSGSPGAQIQLHQGSQSS